MANQKSSLFHAVVMDGCTMFACGGVATVNGSHPTPASSGTPNDMGMQNLPDMNDHRDGFHPTK